MALNCCYEDENDGRELLRDDLRHRDDGSAIEEEIIDEDGSKFCCKNGVYHREDGPAVEYADGGKIWFREGVLHRDDGPAADYADGTKYWYFKGVFVGDGDKPDPDLWEWVTSEHGLNGRIVDLDGDTRHYLNDLLHREDGPAFEPSDGVVEWYLNGKSCGWGAKGFWAFWNLLTEDQRKNPNLLKYKEEYEEHKE